jgi:hypothetical protein
MLDVLAFFHSAPFLLLARCANFPRIIEKLHIISLTNEEKGDRGAALYREPKFQSLTLSSNLPRAKTPARIMLELSKPIPLGIFEKNGGYPLPIRFFS